MNQVHLIGVVGSLPPDGGTARGAGFVLLTERADVPGVERHRVVLRGRGLAEPVAVGDSVYVRGHLEWRGSRPVVVFGSGFQLAAGVVPAGGRDPTATGGTHRSPLPHERRGHLRRVGAGTPRERLVWVRPTLVGG